MPCFDVFVHLLEGLAPMSTLGSSGESYHSRVLSCAFPFALEWIHFSYGSMGIQLRLSCLSDFFEVHVRHVSERAPFPAVRAEQKIGSRVQRVIPKKKICRGKWLEDSSKMETAAGQKPLNISYPTKCQTSRSNRPQPVDPAPTYPSGAV